MAVSWTLSTAIASLRRRLSDGPTDKYRHQAEVDPSPNGIHRRFGVADSRLVPGTLQLFLDGEAITVATRETRVSTSTGNDAPTGTDTGPPLGEPVGVQETVTIAVVGPAIDYEAGYFETDAPDEGQNLVASYYFQWFTDADLEEFLQAAVQLLHYDDIEDSAVPSGLRTPILSFAAYFAYTKMAGQSAPALMASSAGFTSDSSKEHPYWMNLAKLAWDEALKAIEVFNENPVSAQRPTMRFVRFRMQPWVPRS